MDERDADRAEPHRDGLRPLPGRRRIGQGAGRGPAATNAKTLRALLFCVPARIIATARQTILRLPAGFRHAEALSVTYHAALALPAP